jgi:polysaccharide export outer membrane protein
VEEEMKEYVPDVPVTVMLVRLSSTRVYVIGKVQQPGGFLLNDETRVLQILALAGGLTTFADSGGIVVIRDHGQEQELIEIDYDEIAEGKDLSQNIVLEPGDTIVVP